MQRAVDPPARTTRDIDASDDVMHLIEKALPGLVERSDWGELGDRALAEWMLSLVDLDRLEGPANSPAVCNRHISCIIGRILR